MQAKNGRLVHRSPEHSSNNGNVVIFETRKPFISELYDRDTNVRSLCQVIFITVIGVFITIILRDSIDAGRLHWQSFSSANFDYPDAKCLLGAVSVDICYHIIMISIHPFFNLWLRSRNVCNTSLTDVSFIGIYAITVLSTFVFNVWACTVYFRFPGFIRLALTAEQLRVVMKSYSFIRENAYKVLYPWHKDDTSGPAVWYKGQMSPVVGSFKQYCYFVFAPTLLYRDHYPRSSGPINWTTVATNLCFFVGGLMVAQQILCGARVYDYKWSSVLLSFMFTIGMALILLPLFTVYVTHGWMNMWAEIIRFGDRRYYEDWWACTKYQEYYRKWNIIPYHFNHQYIYKDIRKVTGSTLFAAFLLISISSIVHEYVIAVTMGFILPALTIFFAGIGVFVIFFSLGSKYILLSLCIGGTMTFWPYFIEGNARILCPREETWVDLVYPRSIECFIQYNL